MNNIAELVFAIPTDEIWKLIPYKKAGLIKGDTKALNLIVQKGLFRKRSELEEDQSFKQLISYAVLSNNDSFYLFKRISGQREKRLHNKFSLGIGGHMNPGNPEESGEGYLIQELKRELKEEVRLLNGCVIEDIEFIGFINDDTIPVGRVHIGLLYNIRVSNQDLCINETDKMTAEWVTGSKLAEFYDGMETWTRITFDYYIK